MFILSDSSRQVTILSTTETTLQHITIPSQTRSNGASIPRLFWSALGYHPLSKQVYRAAFLHDYLISIYFDGATRDYLFYCQLLEDKCIPWKAKIMWQAVVLWRWWKVKIRGKKF